MEVPLKVITLNCWGIRIPVVGSKLITKRFAAIAELINKNDYDIVVFQEVWSTNDYVSLSCKILDKLPHTHYFHGGFLGSGVCIFSRYPILETFYHDYPLNGHAHKLLHGDWYGSKGCGLATLKVKELTVNLYATHMHARYNHSDEFDEYCSHRASQAFSLSQFVKHTSACCDAVIVTGDFNSTPNELAYKIIRSNAVLNDAWLIKNAEGVHRGGYTCDTPENCFTPAAVTACLPEGQRVDYIFYRANQSTDLRLDECRVLTDKIPDTDINYSDHYAVEAKMSIKRNITAGQVPEADVSVRQQCIKDLLTVVDKGCIRARSNKYFYFVTMLLALMVLLMCRERYVGNVGDFLHTVLEIIQGVMAVMAGMSLWISFVMSRLEGNAYLSQKTDLQNLLNSSTLSKLKKQD